MYKKILVAGATSYIASLVIPRLDYGNSQVFFATRGTNIPENLKAVPDHRILKNVSYQNPMSSEEILRSIALSPNENLLILNFVGSLGHIPETLVQNPSDFHQTFKENLDPFLCLTDVFLKAAPMSLYLSFSGAGLGGDRLDSTSLAYTSAKASMAVLAEIFDREHVDFGYRFGLVAPGAFPSKMQSVVANLSSIRSDMKERIGAANETLDGIPNSEKLANLINFLIRNPDQAGGRIWSANHDNFWPRPKSPNFGKLRRIT
jgi:hypothetical protein